MRREIYAVRKWLANVGDWLDGMGYALLADEWRGHRILGGLARRNGDRLAFSRVVSRQLVFRETTLEMWPPSSDPRLPPAPDRPPRMRAVSHPVRLALIEVVTLRGPLTATEAGELIDETRPRARSTCASWRSTGSSRRPAAGWVGPGRGAPCRLGFSIDPDPRRRRRARSPPRPWPVGRPRPTGHPPPEHSRPSAAATHRSGATSAPTGDRLVGDP